MNIKSLIFIVLILALLVAGAYFAYTYFFQNESPLKSGDEIIIEPQMSQRIIPLSKEKVLAPAIDESGKKIKYYDKATGNMHAVNFNGTNASTLSTAKLAGILRILWSPDKNKVIGFFKEGEQFKKYLHDYQTGKSTSLKEQVEQAVWAPDNNKIAVQTYDQEKNTSIISIANTNGEDLKPIFQTRIKDLILEWPAIDKISIRTKPSGLSEGLIFVANPDNGDFRSILKGSYGLGAKWSPLGNLLLYSSTNFEGKNVRLSTISHDGQNQKDLGIATLADKCAFSQDNRTLFCAVPQKLSENAVWPDDYYKGLTVTSDNFLKINLDTGQKDAIFSPDPLSKSYDASELFLSPEEKYLFFVNKKDGLLYGLKL